ncbi:ribonuclease P [Candidatus Woesearchaeota archaeon]|nr:ribonuclease P [Candidatus Woesearchaeota archaeon]
MKKKSLKDVRKVVARERIKTLFEQARQRPKYAKRYVALARKLQQKYRLRFTHEQSRAFCKKCCALFDAKNVSVRTKEGHVVYTCRECGHIRRYPYKKVKK